MSGVTKCLLLGNGFDLHHKLPTKYIHILQVFKFWSENHDNNFESIGQLLGSYYEFVLKKPNYDISKDEVVQHYLKHKAKLDLIRIENQEILITVDNSFWFQYFLNSKYEDIGWIDFELEIQRVLNLFDYIISNNISEGEIVEAPNLPVFQVLCSYHNPKCIYICKLDNDREYITVLVDRSFLNNDLLSAKCSYRADEIAKYLYDDLDDVKKVIKFYITHIIDSVLDDSMKSKNMPFIYEVDYVLNLNYSETAERIYGIGNETITHYHGKASNNIVLGINSSFDDELNESRQVNTTFIMFKKYYQRIIMDFDKKHMNFLSFLQDHKIHRSGKHAHIENAIELAVVGHSLDKSDEDIIIELFNLCDRVYVYYYDVIDHGKYIKNLTAIFGRTAVLEMRKIGKLTFYKLPAYEC